MHYPNDKLFRDLDYCMRGVENRDLRERLARRIAANIAKLPELLCASRETP
jgi:hypothetical protein